MTVQCNFVPWCAEEFEDTGAVVDHLEDEHDAFDRAVGWWTDDV